MRTRITPPLSVESGRSIVDADQLPVVTCTRDVAHAHVLTPHATDELVQELVARYNAYPQLIELMRTVMRETSPASSAAFNRTFDLPRIHTHVKNLLNELGVSVTVPGGPAVLEIPPPPEHRDHSGIAKDTWAEAWVAGYTAAWNGIKPTTTSPEKK